MITREGCVVGVGRGGEGGGSDAGSILFLDLGSSYLRLFNNYLNCIYVLLMYLSI